MINPNQNLTLMKKYGFLAALALTLVFTACSIEKRHYMDGYHVQWNHHQKHTAQNTTTAVAENNTTTTAADETPAPVVTENTVTETSVTPLAASPVVPATVEENTAVSQTAQPVSGTATTVEPKQVKKHKFMQQRVGNTPAPGADDEDTLVLVLLCLFLPPLAVFLYEGSTWTNRCTVNLILTLLCGIPGIIHAFIVCFGGK